MGDAGPDNPGTDLFPHQEEMVRDILNSGPQIYTTANTEVRGATSSVSINSLQDLRQSFFGAASDVGLSRAEQTASWETWRREYATNFPIMRDYTTNSASTGENVEARRFDTMSDALRYSRPAPRNEDVIARLRRAREVAMRESAGDVREMYVSRDDFAELAAAASTDRGRGLGYAQTGPDRATFMGLNIIAHPNAVDPNPDIPHWLNPVEWICEEQRNLSHIVGHVARGRAGFLRMIESSIGESTQIRALGPRATTHTEIITFDVPTREKARELRDAFARREWEQRPRFNEDGIPY